MKQYLVFNVGCIECGVSSKVVGVFTIKAMADNIAKQCEEKHHWREHGQNSYEVFELPALNLIDPEYEGVTP